MVKKEIRIIIQDALNPNCHLLPKGYNRTLIDFKILDDLENKLYLLREVVTDQEENIINPLIDWIQKYKRKKYNFVGNYSAYSIKRGEKKQ